MLKMKLMLCVVLMVIAMVMAEDSPTVTLYTKTKHMEDSITQVEGTDGARYLLAVYQPSTGVINCYTVTETDKLPTLILSVMNDANTVATHFDIHKLNELFLTCQIHSTHLKAVKVLAALTNTTAPVRDNTSPPPAFFRTASVKSWTIFPGTKWCGGGNKAEHFDDLGTFVETDKCCRTHDHCPHSIPSFKSRYGYFNWYPWTLSHCQCDEDFGQCLQAARSSEVAIATTVENVFFNVLEMRCFHLDPDNNAYLN